MNYIERYYSSSPIQRVGNVPHIQVCLLGDGGTGKSAFVLQYLHSYFAENYDPTIEDTYSKQIQIDRQSVVLDILDTAGQDEYSSMRESQIADTHAIIMTFRIDSRESLNAVYLLHQLVTNVRGTSMPPLFLVGTMSDLEETRQISREEGRKISQDLKCEAYFETSAKTKTNIAPVFQAVAQASITFYDITNLASPQRSREFVSPSRSREFIRASKSRETTSPQISKDIEIPQAIAEHEDKKSLNEITNLRSSTSKANQGRTAQSKKASPKLKEKSGGCCIIV